MAFNSFMNFANPPATKSKLKITNMGHDLVVLNRFLPLFFYCTFIPEKRSEKHLATHLMLECICCFVICDLNSQ